MGCATSKKRPVCRNCRGPCDAPMSRSYSMHVHHPPQSDGDSYHLVALKSTTLGYLQLDPSNSGDVRGVKNPGVVQIRQEHVRQNEIHKESKEFAVGVIDAKTWSKMIDEKIPKIVPRTPIRTPPGEPETINAWELMEGLDDTSPLRPKSTANHIRSFSFHVNPNSFTSHLDEPATEFQEKDRQIEISGNPLCLPIPENSSDSNSLFDSHDTSVASDFDTDVIIQFRKSLELLPPANPFHLKPSIDDKEPPAAAGYGDESLDTTNSKKSLQNGFFGDGKATSPPRVQEKLVLYFTSLRGVRKTYEDCCHVRHILKVTGVRVDERDVSMHSGFKDELKELLGGFIGGGLPKVFIGDKCIGGATEIRRLHEDGHLEKALEGCEMVDGGGCGYGGAGGGGGGVGGCEACGDIRFLPCETCSGSCKIYYEDESDEIDDEEKEENDYGFQRCPDCNENGLIRCPICCD